LQGIQARDATSRDPLHQVLEKEQKARLDLALRKLRPENQTIILMRAAGYAYTEISTVLGINTGALRQRYSDLISRLRKEILTGASSEIEK
jgi:RNA polymerase sigma factor (sigma-70 family)